MNVRFHMLFSCAGVCMTRKEVKEEESSDEYTYVTTEGEEEPAAEAPTRAERARKISCPCADGWCHFCTKHAGAPHVSSASEAGSYGL